MDVAFRPCPEVDIYGMIGDVKRAIAWRKANASRHGLDPGKIVQLSRPCTMWIDSWRHYQTKIEDHIGRLRVARTGGTQ
jgi:hypothetical protein